MFFSLNVAHVDENVALSSLIAPTLGLRSSYLLQVFIFRSFSTYACPITVNSEMGNPIDETWHFSHGYG